VPAAKNNSRQSHDPGGLPAQLRSGIEQLSGISLSGAKVHYNSTQPAQFKAHAYAQGSEIHLATGQEKHLPHEAWHLVQQRQGRVQPTTQLKGTGINDDSDLENEADQMGAEALSAGINISDSKDQSSPATPVQSLQFQNINNQIRAATATLNHSDNTVTQRAVVRQLVAARFLVDDGVPVSGGQVTKSEFLSSLRSAVKSVASEVLAPAGLAQNDCPDLNYWISFYEAKDAAYTEQAITRYAPATAEAKDYGEFLDQLTARVRAGLAQHLQTGSREVEPGEAPESLVEKRPPRAELTLQRSAADPIQLVLCGGGGLATRAQVALEAAHDRNLVNQLYTDGANALQVTQLLTAEHDANLIHALILGEANGNAAAVLQLYGDGATTIQIQQMQAVETNAVLIHARILGEANLSAGAIHLLYHDGATTVQIQQMQAVETNAFLIHTRILGEANLSAAAIHQLYGDGATTIQIQQMQVVETNAVLIHTRILAEANLSAAAIHQLYRDGATTVQIQQMQAVETNAVLIHARILAEANLSAAAIHQLYRDGATTVQIQQMQVIETDGLLIHARILAEATLSAAAIHRLYHDGATTVQIQQMQAVETNAVLIHARILAEANLSAAAIHQLYRDGATTLQIQQMQAVETNAVFIHARIMLEGTNHATAIHSLYRLGVSSAHMLTLLGHEPNAQSLQGLVRRESHRNAAAIIQLYVDGATTAQIAGSLIGNRDAANVRVRVQGEPGYMHRKLGEATADYTQPVDPRFSVANLLYASMSSGRYGSVYFNQGRIRLAHGSAPDISLHLTGIERYTISNADYLLYKAWKPGHTFTQKYAYVTVLPSCQLAAVGAAGHLFEFFGPNGVDGNHPSRGGPIAFPPITQNQLNIIYNAANENNDNRLRLAMATDPVLAAIPMN
jgi:hypothetical protein